MLQLTNGTICEQPPVIDVTMTGNAAQTYTGQFTIGNCVPSIGYYDWQPYTFWNSYPVYVCTDKTKKAIEVLKALQADKVLTCNSVPRFIELVEKISGLL